LSARAALYIAVGLGSGLGAAARYLCSLGAGAGFPWGTLIVNGLGSFIIGFYATLSEPGGRLFPNPALRHFVLTGFCGGFTTFSMFSLETLRLAQSKSLFFAGANVGVSLILWLFAAWTGHAIAQRISRLRGGRSHEHV
jgi:CrcB protein